MSTIRKYASAVVELWDITVSEIIIATKASILSEKGIQDQICDSSAGCD